MSYIEFTDIEKHYGTLRAVCDFNLSVSRGEMIALLGPSGCGKTTTLRMLAGFLPVSRGTMQLDGRDITAIPPHRRNIGMVFQGYALFPHMSVAKNIAFGLEMRRLSAAEIAQRVAQAQARVRLQGFENRLPGQLSGGQQQRVALARAMAINPDVLLLDEPLSALDARLRHEVRVEIRELQRELQLTTLIVTHDQDEAMSMADRLVVMNKGRIEQIGTPADIYEKPANRFVAEFMGTSNFLEGRVEGPGSFRSSSGEQFTFSGPANTAATCLAFRPERARLAGSEVSHDASMNAVHGRVLNLTYLGASVDCRVLLDVGQSVSVLLPNTSAYAGSLPSAGQRVKVLWAPEDCRVLA